MTSLGLSSFSNYLTSLYKRNTQPLRFTRDLLLGILIGTFISLASGTSALYWQNRRVKRAVRRDVEKRPIELRSEEVVDGVIGLIGNTPLIRINSLSSLTGVNILGKAEFLNPGGSIKDRVALRILTDAEQSGLLYPNTGSMVFEGSVGSTGISFALLCRAKGYGCTVVMPDDVAMEKVEVLERLGATVKRVRPASIVDEKQFVNLAKSLALSFGKSELPSSISEGESIVVTTTVDEKNLGGELGAESLFGKGDKEGQARGFFADQFENNSNFLSHLHSTGPEIYSQTSGLITAFVSGAGTGGTLSGVATYLKSMDEKIKIVLADPEGSGLFNKVKYGVMFDQREREGRKRRHQVDTVVEGIGINRLTENFEKGRHLIDDAYRVTDAEAVAMSRHLVKEDGLFLGSSAACNLVAAVRLAKTLPAGSTIVTILCDSGSRHQSKFWSNDYLRANNIPISDDISDIIGS